MQANDNTDMSAQEFKKLHEEKNSEHTLHELAKEAGYKRTEPIKSIFELVDKKQPQQILPQWLVAQNKDPWSFADLFDKLLEGTRILLHEKDFDRHGWEDFEHCYQKGKALSEQIRKGLPVAETPITKTLLDFKNEIAIEEGYKSFKAMEEAGEDYLPVLCRAYDEVAYRYGMYMQNFIMSNSYSPVEMINLLLVNALKFLDVDQRQILIGALQERTKIEPVMDFEEERKLAEEWWFGLSQEKKDEYYRSFIETTNKFDSTIIDIFQYRKNGKAN